MAEPLIGLDGLTDHERVSRALSLLMNAARPSPALRDAVIEVEAYTLNAEQLAEENARLRALVNSLAGEAEPMARGWGNVDDEFCWYCGSDRVHRHHQDGTGGFPLHEPECPWVAAMRLLGRDLSEHMVKPDPILSVSTIEEASDG